MAKFNPRIRKVAQAAVGDGNSSTPLKKMVARLLAVRTSWTLVLALTPVWFLILAVWILSLITIFATSFVSLATSYLSFLPVQWISDLSDSAALSFILLAWILHLITFMIAFIAYFVSGVECTSTWLLNILMILIAMSLIPGIQFIPWVFFYLFAIVYLQTGKKLPW